MEAAFLEDLLHYVEVIGMRITGAHDVIDIGNYVWEIPKDETNELAEGGACPPESHGCF